MPSIQPNFVGEISPENAEYTKALAAELKGYLGNSDIGSTEALALLCATHSNIAESLAKALKATKSSDFWEQVFKLKTELPSRQEGDRTIGQLDFVLPNGAAISLELCQNVGTGELTQLINASYIK